MKRLVGTILVLAVAAGAVGVGVAGAGEPSFPELEGLVLAPEVRRHGPETLFEYIDGKADGYLDFAFRDLVGRDYRTGSGKTIAVDLYRHATANDAYGIFSSERPADAANLGIGAAGYLDRGHLNFFQDVYYVKIAGEGLGEGEGSVLEDLAARVAENLPGEPALPPALSCFPVENLVPNSIRYVTRGFLGHSFLHSAFVAEYGEGDETYRAFILEGADVADCDAMLQGYLDLVRRKGGEAVEEDGVHRFYDPYRTFEGVLNLEKSGTRLLGVFHNDPEAAGRCLDALESGLSDEDR